MTDRETEFVTRWHNEQDIYSAWGEFVCETLTECLKSSLEREAFDRFIRIPVKHRLKDESSLLAKAFHRNKNYCDPYNDIEDKVGARVVVLLTADIRIVEKCILSCSRWEASMARDFEHERAQNPNVFDYQSLHYIVRSKGGNSFSGISISDGVPCEIQIRTLLQHAYSELTHDTIYKPSVTAEHDIKRAAAKSMALIEATDDYFTQVHSRISELTAPTKILTDFVLEVYNSKIKLVPTLTSLNTLMIDHFKTWATENFETDLPDFLDWKPFIVRQIQEKYASSLIYRQPAILLVYFAISRAPKSAWVGSPLSDNEMAPVYSDLGLTLMNGI
jgi:putative GTP pyrophosphokinase